MAEKVAEKHGQSECSVDIAARVLRVAPVDVPILVEAGAIKSPRRDPAGEQVIDYGSVIDYMVRVRKQGSLAQAERGEPK